MSNAALNWAFAMPIRGAGKHVLIALANRADAEGVCYPTQALLSLETGLTERSVRAGLDALESMGLIESQRRNGRLSRYVLKIDGVPVDEPKPEASSGLPENPKPEAISGLEAPNRKLLPVKPEATSGKPTRTSKVSKKEKGTAKIEKARGGRLPLDWQPNLEDIAFAESVGLAPRAVAASFRDYWHSKTGANATKLDWSATWRNWCRKDAEKKPTRPSAYRNGFLAMIEADANDARTIDPDEPVTAFLRLLHVH